MGRPATSTCLGVVALLTACSSAPETGTDVFVTTSVVAEPTITVESFVEDAVTLDSCVLSAPGVVEVAGAVDLGITGVAEEAPAEAELVVEVTMGGTVVAGTHVGTIERSGTFAVTYPLEEVHDATAAAVVESRIGDEAFPAGCRALLLTAPARFLPANEVTLEAADGVELREP